MASAVMKRLARNLRRLASERGIALAHLADRAGIARSTLGRLLDGSGDVRVSTLAVLAAALGVQLCELLADVADPKPPGRRVCRSRREHSRARSARLFARLVGPPRHAGLGRERLEEVFDVEAKHAGERSECLDVDVAVGLVEQAVDGAFRDAGSAREAGDGDTGLVDAGGEARADAGEGFEARMRVV
jgi:transcriptional regulator with XRE-family HTH domain